MPSVFIAFACTLLLGLSTAFAQEEITLGAQQFEIHCKACHQAQQLQVGPSIHEVGTLYRKKPKAFLKWCLNPGKKRAEAIQMPSMAHVGEDNLRAIYAYLMDETKDMKDFKPSKRSRAKSDQYSRAQQRPQVQRMFIKDSGPAAIAVALPQHQLNYTFDAGQCRLRFVWKGDFIDSWPYWRGNGKAEIEAKGTLLYQEECPPFLVKGKSDPSEARFLGYDLDPNGIPTFRYQRDGVTLEETITSNAKGDGLIRKITTTPSTPLLLEAPEGIEVTKTADSTASSLSFELKW